MKPVYILLITALITGCSSTVEMAVDIGEDSDCPPSLSDMGLLWLSLQQAPDGSWGQEEKTRVLITSLCCVAFLSHGESPTSEQFGAVVENALRYLVESSNQYEVAETSIIDPASALAWVLGDAYDVTSIPIVGKRVDELRERVIAQAQTPTPFDVWSTHILPTNQILRTYQTQLSAYRAFPGNLLNQACIALLTRKIDSSAQWWKPYDAEVSKLVALNPRNWRESEYPMLTLVVLIDVFAEASDRHRAGFWKSVWGELLSAQGLSGCLTPTALAVEQSAEVSSFPNEHDRILYTTCMSVIARNQLYRFTRCRHGDQEE